MNWNHKFKEYWDRSTTSYLSTNMHALLSNIELRTMNEENNPGTVMEIVESGVELEKQRIEENLLIKRMKPVTMTDIATNKGRRVENENSIARQDSYWITWNHR